MARASRIMLFHYLGYFGSMILVWLVMILSPSPQPIRILLKPVEALLLIASLLFGIFGLLYVLRGGHRGG
ncbi:MAG: hypothetical protein RQ885_13450 [Desulfurococcales archaeon]|jgi:hypothetical protein|nr:hypothetical protein [Desulfurococcales archaeon]